MIKIKRLSGLGAFFGSALVSLGAMAETGQPSPWQISLQASATPVMTEIHWFHDKLLLPIITVITLFVLALLLTVMIRFRKSANPTPSRTSHNTLIEVAWTVLPILVLLVIAVPSFRLLYLQRTMPSNPDITIKAIGQQWYWSYEYKGDYDGVAFDANIVRADLNGDGVEEFAGNPRLLETDLPVVVPVGKVVLMEVTADPTGVIHSWTVPSFGAKVDAVPGRLNELWFKAERTGVYYGQCSELCGAFHAFMPIEVHVVDEDVFKQWAAAAKDDTEEAKKLLAELTGKATAKVAAK